MSNLNNSLLLGAPAGATTYQVSRSLRFSSGDSSYLSRTPASAGNRQSWTWSGWVKRGKIDSGTTVYGLFGAYSVSTNYGYLAFYQDGLRFTDRPAAGTNALLQTTQVFRDPSAWYHLVLVWDGANSTSSDRVQLYVNGSRIASFSTSTYPSTSSSVFNSAIGHSLGRDESNAGYFDGYLADINFIDGQALTPSSFAETDATTGQWIPKAYTGSYGTNGFKLTFADNSNNTASTLGKDTSGNGLNWTPNNFSVTAGAGNDSLVDTPTSYGTDTGVGNEVRGNYCTFNPLFALASLTLTNGNLETSSPGAAWRNAKGTFAMTTGKWYWEHTVPTTGAADGYIGGVATATADYSSSSTGIWGRQGTTKYSNGSSSTPFGSTTSGDILGFAFDADAGKLWVAQNGTWVGDPGAGTGESWSGIPSGVFPYVAAYNQANVVNFGQRAFAYTNNRSGFKALCDTNLPAPLTAKPDQVFQATLWTGNGGSQSISSLSFSPDFVWIKARSAGTTSHCLFDTIRGATKGLHSDQTIAEWTDTATLTAFNSNGFTLAGHPYTNGNGTTYVGWTWDAGTSTVTNTQGSITSSVRANASAGFSIVTYTGTGSSATVGHGLGVAPGLIIVKRRSATGSTANWAVWHSQLTAGQNLFLNTTDGASAYSPSRFTSTLPTSTVFSLGTADDSNYNTGTFVAYAFAPVTGYSSFGSYTGNGSSDGPFVFTGHRSRWILIKDTGSGNWRIYDTARDSYNQATAKLYPNSSTSENAVSGESASTNTLDLLSNGFKLRTSNSETNFSGNTYIWASFAESPFAYARAR